MVPGDYADGGALCSTIHLVMTILCTESAADTQILHAAGRYLRNLRSISLVS